MKNHHISEAVVSFENIVWSVYQDMCWRTHFLHMAANYRLKTIPFEPRHEKTYLRGLRPGKTQTDLLSYRD